MGLHIQLDLKAVEQAPSVARAAGITLEQQLVGLVFMYHYVWAQKSDHATRDLLSGWFAVSLVEVDRLAGAEVAFGHLEVREGGWRIRGAKRYFSLRAKLSEGGKKSKGNLKQYSTPAAPVAEPVAAKKSRGPSAQEECWDIMERLRVEHCLRLELAPGQSKRPKLCNLKLNDAIAAAGILDSIDGLEAFTRWDMLTLLFERYLGDELGRNNQEGQLRDPPWPLELFLSPNVLQRFKREHDQEQAA
jgi:hypothetical protein